MWRPTLTPRQDHLGYIDSPHKTAQKNIVKLPKLRYNTSVYRGSSVVWWLDHHSCSQGRQPLGVVHFLTSLNSRLYLTINFPLLQGLSSFAARLTGLIRNSSSQCHIRSDTRFLPRSGRVSCFNYVKGMLRNRQKNRCRWTTAEKQCTMAGTKSQVIKPLFLTLCVRLLYKI